MKELKMFGILNQTILILLVLVAVTTTTKVKQPPKVASKPELNKTSKIMVGKKSPNGDIDLKQNGATCCYSYPCHNGGTCYVTNFGYVCSCPFGITGTNCEISMKLFIRH